MGRNSDNYLLDDFEEEDNKPRGDELEYKPEALSHQFFARTNKYSKLGVSILTELAKYEHSKDSVHLTNITKIISESK